MKALPEPSSLITMDCSWPPLLCEYQGCAVLTATALETAMWNMADKASLEVREHEHLHAIQVHI